MQQWWYLQLNELVFLDYKEVEFLATCDVYLEHEKLLDQINDCNVSLFKVFTIIITKFKSNLINLLSSYIHYIV